MNSNEIVEYLDRKLPLKEKDKRMLLYCPMHDASDPWVTARAEEHQWTVDEMPEGAWKLTQRQDGKWEWTA